MSMDSEKVLETKERIRSAFFALYAEKKIERISIKEITEKAKLNRGTFYVYYHDIYDLLESTEEEVINELIQKIRGVATMIIREGDIFSHLPPYEFYRKYSPYLRVLLGNNGDPNFVYRIKSILKKMLRELLLEEHVPIIPNIDYVLEFMASAQIGMISYWMQNNMELSIEEIGELTKQLALNGPIGFLKIQKVIPDNMHQ